MVGGAEALPQGAAQGPRHAGMAPALGREQPWLAATLVSRGLGIRKPRCPRCDESPAPHCFLQFWARLTGHLDDQAQTPDSSWPS